MPATGIEPVRCRHHRILSPARLPVPPRRHIHIVFLAHEINFTHFRGARQILTQAFAFPRYSRKWAEVDSNHRSNLQQIYSLSPLATRESTHLNKMSFAFYYLIVCIFRHKADDRTRTDNLLITNQLLCQLSHIGIFKITKNK